MNVKEKILLVQLLLEDIRGNWGHGCYGMDAEHRALKAKSLCQEIAAELNDNNYMTLADECNEYIRGSYEWGDWDGVFARSMDLDKDYPLPGLFPIGADGPTGDGYGVCYVNGKTFADRAISYLEELK